MDVAIGSIWVDKDKRMLSGNRRVRVQAVVDGFVSYRSVTFHGQDIGPVYRSRRMRFVRAFRSEAAAPEGN